MTYGNTMNPSAVVPNNAAFDGIREQVNQISQQFNADQLAAQTYL